MGAPSQHRHLASAIEHPRVHVLPRLPYSFDALEPHIDAQTLQIHYRKHHQGYIDALHRALEGHPEWQSRSTEALCREIAMVPDEIRIAVRNAGGGHWNHTRLWAWMTPNSSGAPFGRAADAIASSFGDYATFKTRFAEQALQVFGSGWAWLVKDGAGVRITTTPNQDNPLMAGVTPILGLDVWEHAYYLKYQNRRADYIKAWWNVINWTEVNRAL
jgi:Fe-Mn family superoxide dismutase